jgi:hypothetical protein
MTPDLWFDDLREGDRCASGPVPVEREAALAFARAFDPQPYHLNEEAPPARSSRGSPSAASTRPRSRCGSSSRPDPSASTRSSASASTTGAPWGHAPARGRDHRDHRIPLETAGQRPDEARPLQPGQRGRLHDHRADDRPAPARLSRKASERDTYGRSRSMPRRSRGALPTLVPTGGKSQVNRRPKLQPPFSEHR